MKILPKILIIFLSLVLASCEHTKGLWNNTYKEEFKQILVSANNRQVTFLSKKYHYVFNDDFGAIKEIIRLDAGRTVLFNQKRTNLKIDKDNNLSGYFFIETFNYRLTPEETYILTKLGFRDFPAAKVLALELPVQGRRYPVPKDWTPYAPVLKISYALRVEKTENNLGLIPKILLTPFEIGVDFFMLLYKGI